MLSLGEDFTLILKNLNYENVLQDDTKDDIDSTILKMIMAVIEALLGE